MDLGSYKIIKKAVKRKVVIKNKSSTANNIKNSNLVI